MENKKEKKYLLIILIAAFLIRFISGEAFKIYNPERYDSFHFKTVQSVLQTGKLQVDIGWGSAEASRQPLYPLFLALIQKIFGKSPDIFILFSAIISSLIVLSAFYLAKEMFDGRIALLSAVITAFYPYYVINSGAVTDGPLFTFLLVCSLLVLLRAFKKPFVMNFIFSGFMLGITVLCRAAVLPMTIFVVIGVFFYFRASKISVRLKYSVIFISAFIIALSPCLMRNYIVLGKPALTSSLGQSLWISTHPDLLINGYPEITIDRHIDKIYSEIPGKERSDYMNIPDMERNDIFSEKASGNISNMNKTKLLKYAYAKLISAYSPFINPVYDKYIRSTAGTLKKAAYSLPYLTLSVLSLIGLFIYRKNVLTVFLVVSLYLSISLIFMIFWAHSQHRAPLDVYMIIFSSAAIIHIIDKRINHLYEK